MNRTMSTATVGILAAVAALGVAGCMTSDDQNLEKSLVKINRRLDAIDKQLAQGVPAGAPARGAAAAPGRPAPQQRPPGPDPATVYAVPIDGAPFVGASDAKITVVAAFEFA
jgi:protein-disulfide isomerase